MNAQRKYLFLATLIFLALPFLSFCQNPILKDSSDLKLIAAAKDIMKSAGTCALITLDNEGCARVRTMDPFLPEDDLTVWFGTKSESRKVSQIKKDPRVTLYYLSSDASGYVTIHGKAELVNDPKEKENHWKDRWESFYNDRSKDYLLIKVSPIWMEVVSETHGIFGDSKTWQPPVVKFY